MRRTEDPQLRLSRTTILTHVLGTAVAATAILGFTFLPFLPGSYDPAAQTLSFLAQLFGVVGLLLVPVGAGWLGYEMRWRASSPRDRRRAFALAAVVIAMLVAGIVSLAALASSLAIGGTLLLLCAGTLAVGIRRLRRLRRQSPTPRAADLTALYLVAVPVLVVAVQWTLVDRAVAASRTTAIDNASELIRDIEAYRAANGQYPESLLALWPDYLPGTVGVSHYSYQRSGAAYTLSFEQFRFRPFGTREVVVYSPLDQHTFVSHAAWRLSDPELEGWYAVHDADRPHWKYFWFD